MIATRTPALPEHLDPVAVSDMEGLYLIVVVIAYNAPVSHHAVDIENKKFDFLAAAYLCLTDLPFFTCPFAYSSYRLITHFRSALCPFSAEASYAIPSFRISCR